MKLSPLDIVIGDRIRKNADIGIEKLAKSIKELGQLYPVLIDSDDKLIDGMRRLRACELLRIDVECKKVLHLDDAILHLKAERDTNETAVPFTKSEAVELGKRLELLEKPKAEERRRATQNNDAGKSSSSKLDEQDKGRTDDKVSAAVGMSKDTYRKAKAVVDAAAQPDASPEVKQAKEDMDRTGKVDPAYKAVQKKTKPKKKTKGPYWSIDKDVKAIQSLVDKLKKKWSDTDRETVREFFSRLAKDV